MANMSSNMNNRYTQSLSQPRFSIAALISGIFLALVIGLISLVTMMGIFYHGKIYPGVAVSGVDVSNLSVQEAEMKLASAISYSQTGKIILTDSGSNWIATPMELGYYPDFASSAQQAYELGRGGFILLRPFYPLVARFMGVNIPGRMIYEQGKTQAYLQKIAGEIDKPVLEASISIQGTDVQTIPGQTGRTLDIQATTSLIGAQLSALQDGIIAVVVNQKTPKVVDLSAQADVIRKILAEPLRIRMPGAGAEGPGPWAIGPADLAKMITFDHAGNDPAGDLVIGLDQLQLSAYLENVATYVDQQPTNARFIFNDDTRQLDLLSSAVVGRQVDINSTLATATEKLLQGGHDVDLAVVTHEPEVPDTATAESLGITELVHAETSYFYGSNGSRIQNIKTAASEFHGLLIPPGGIVSMADIMGDISLDNGYSEALIIYGDQTIKGVGGGVCQVSTTLFRAAFFSGFPILERYAHAYRVGYYEQTASGGRDPSLAGLDATVFIPVVDMKFKNDTPYWLLMETYPTDTSLTWKFYSTYDGRTVSWETTGPVNIVKAPDPKYVENPDMAKGRFKQIDYSADGADVDVLRTVYKDGQAYFTDSFKTHYVPWQAVYEMGEGTKVPKNPPDL